MLCDINLGDDFACKCSLPKHIIQIHSTEVSACYSSYYLRQMHMCQVGSKLFQIKLSKPTSWGACFCKQYLDRKCTLIRVNNKHMFLENDSTKVILEMHFQQSMLCMVVSPLSVGLTLVPIQRCIRRFVKYRHILKEKALYWANSMTQMCMKQKSVVKTIQPALHQIVLNEDLLQMILQSVIMRSSVFLFTKNMAPLE
jgi:hypothetical protein